MDTTSTGPESSRSPSSTSAPEPTLIAHDDTLSFLALRESIQMLNQARILMRRHDPASLLIAESLLRLTYISTRCSISSDFRSECLRLNRSLRLELIPEQTLSRP